MDLSERDIELYLEYFHGREDFFATQSDGHYSPIQRTFDSNYLNVHLLGLATFGVYVLTQESKCNFICFDIDIPKNELDQVNFYDNEIKFNYVKNNMLSLINAIKNRLHISEDQLLLEDTGGRGYHIWIFFEDPISGDNAININRIIKKEINIEYEFFPKQANLDSRRKYGNLIKLPLGMHQKYKSRSNFFKINDDTPVTCNDLRENISLLKTVKKIPTSFIEGIILSNPLLDEELGLPEFDTISVPYKNRLMFKKDLEFLFDHCNALKSLKEKAEKGLPLLRKEAFIFANVLLSVEESENFIIETIRKSYGSNFMSQKTKNELDKIRVLHPNSCKNIISHGVCSGYCSDMIKDKNEDDLRKDTNPLLMFLTPKKIPSAENDGEGLLESISDPINIRRSYWKLKRYHKDEDALFYDQFDFDFFEKNLDFNIQYLSILLQNKQEYNFIGYSEVPIPKKINDYGTLDYRKMAYASVYDQIFIQSIFNIVSRNFERKFSKLSYGYRANIIDYESLNIFKDWKDAYPEFRGLLLSCLRDPRNKYYICCDIKKFYDNISHNILIEQMREIIDEEYIFSLLKKAVHLYEYVPQKGLPQGPGYARVLANLYLNDFDNQIVSSCTGYARYVDDFFLFFTDKKQAENGLKKVVELLSALELQLSDDEEKKAEIHSVQDDEVILNKIDNLQYGLFNESRFINYLELPKIKEFYDTVKNSKITEISHEDLSTINKDIPSLLTIISSLGDKQHPIKPEFTYILEHLVSSNRFFPKRLKTIFYSLIDLFKENNCDLQKFYARLDNSHKTYFLLTLYGKYINDPNTWLDLLRNLVDTSLYISGEFVQGFAISIKKQLDPDFNIEYSLLKEILDGNSIFLRSKLFSALDYFKSDTESKLEIRNKLLPHSSYIEKKYFLSEIQITNSSLCDEKFISNLFTSDTSNLLVESCILFSNLTNTTHLFTKLINVISNQTIFKEVTMDYLISKVFEINEISNSHDLEVLYESIDTDEELRRELLNVLETVGKLHHYNKTQPTYNLKSYNQCISFVEGSKLVEEIPLRQLRQYGYTNIQNLKAYLLDLSHKKVISNINSIELDSSKKVLRIKYDTSNLEELNIEFLRVNPLIFFDLVDNIYKKSNYFFAQLNKNPKIIYNNIKTIKNSNEIVFNNIGTILCPYYFINNEQINLNQNKEIPKMISLFMQTLLYDNQEEKIKQIKNYPKIGLELMFSLFVKKLNIKFGNHRYSYDRMHFLLKNLKEIDIKDNYEVTKYFLTERLFSNIYKNCSKNCNWYSISSSIKDVLEDINKVFYDTSFEKVDFKDKLAFGKFNGFHYLSQLLLLLYFNRSYLIKEKDIKEINNYSVLLFFCILCLEAISILKISFSGFTEEFIKQLDLKEILGENYSSYSTEDISRFYELVERLKYDPDVFDTYRTYSLKQLGLVFIVNYNNNISIRDNELKNSIEYILIRRLPDFEMKILKLINQIVATFDTSPRDFKDIDYSDLLSDMLECSLEINRIRRKFRLKRQFGIIKFTPPNLYCKRALHKKTQASASTLYKIPLSNQYPTSKVKSSWDSFESRVFNVVVPNERVLSLISKLSKGKFMGYKFRYLYYGKMELFVDLVLLLFACVFTIKMSNSSILSKIGLSCILTLVGKILLRDFGFVKKLRVISQVYKSIVKYEDTPSNL